MTMPIKRRRNITLPKSEVATVKRAQQAYEDKMVQATKTPIFNSILSEFGITADDLEETHKRMTTRRNTDD